MALKGVYHSLLVSPRLQVGVKITQSQAGGSCEPAGSLLLQYRAEFYVNLLANGLCFVSLPKSLDENNPFHLVNSKETSKMAGDKTEKDSG